MSEIIAKVIPIILLIALGSFIRVKQLFSQNTIDDLKKFVVNMTLSSVLFIAFINMDLKKEYFFITLVILILLNLFYLIGVLLNQIKLFSHPLMPFMIPGFTFGLLGIPLFATVFGNENVGTISIIGLGHELFIWMIFYSLLRIKIKKEKFSLQALTNIFKSPIIISILLGILFNLTGLGNIIQEHALTRGIYTTIHNLSTIATPLILIIIGYGLKFKRQYMRQSMKFLFIRTVVTLTIGYLFKWFIIDYFFTFDPLFEHAYFTFLILPPPFSLSIFVGSYSNKEYEELTNNTIFLGTFLTIIVFITYVLIVL